MFAIRMAGGSRTAWARQVTRAHASWAPHAAQLQHNAVGGEDAQALDEAQALAVDALCLIGERAVRATGVSYVQDGAGGLRCEVEMDRELVADALGASLEAVVASGRSRLRLSHDCFVRQTGPNRLAVGVRVDQAHDTARATNVLTAELGLVSLLARYGGAEAETTWAEGSRSEPAPFRQPSLPAESTEFESPRLPVP